MRISLKNFIRRFKNDVQMIETEMEMGNYDRAIDLCNEWMKLPDIPDECTAFILQLKAQALICKIEFLAAQSDEALEELLEKFEKTVNYYLIYYECSGWLYRRKTKPLSLILIANYNLIFLEDYEFKDWLTDCSYAIKLQEKMRGKVNRLIYAQILTYVAQKTIIYHADSKSAAHLLFRALRIYQKYDPDNINIMRIKLLLQLTDSDRQNADSFIDIFNDYIQYLDDDLRQSNKEQTLFSMNLVLAERYMQDKRIEAAADCFDKVFEYGKSIIGKLPTACRQSVAVLAGMTISAVALFSLSKNKNHLYSVLNLWKYLMSEIQKQHINQTTFFYKDLKAALTGNDAFDFSEAMWALTAEINIGICYIVSGDIRNGLKCVENIERIVALNSDTFDEETAAIYSCGLYIIISAYYRTQEQTEEAEKYRQLYLENLNKLHFGKHNENIFYLYDQFIRIKAEIDENVSDNIDKNVSDDINKKIDLCIRELLTSSFSYGDKEQFENLCMDVITRIVSIDASVKRSDALKIAQDLSRKAKDKPAKKIFKRVCKEFKISTDAEYEALQKII